MSVTFAHISIPHVRICSRSKRQSCMRTARPVCASKPVESQIEGRHVPGRTRRRLLEGVAGGIVLGLGGQLVPLPQQVLAEDSFETALFAGGCFWCMEPPFDKTEGVVATISGYTGGNERNPTYRVVSSGVTGHAEALQVVYDPTKVTYEELLDVFWHQINPTQKDAQFCDSGYQYRSAIFVKNAAEKAAAEASKLKYKEAGVFGKRELLTEITAAKEFWPAEEYHQDYYKKNPTRYAYYRNLCGRDKYLRSIWGQDAGHKDEPATNSTMG